MQFKSLKYLLAIISALATLSGEAQFYTGSHQEFGQNRVQYKRFEWQFYNYKRFKTYFYSGGKNLAIYVAKEAHVALNDLEDLFDFRIDNKIEFIVYNKQSDFKQSNIGLNSDNQTNIGGVTRITGNKVFVYFDGNHQHLNEQIKGGIAQIMLNQMLYGSNWKEALKNTALLSLPDWFTSGFNEHMSKGWNVETDSYVKDAVLNGKFTDNFNALEGQEAIYAGHAIWNFVAEKYGEKVIPNIVYMTKVSRSVESGFLFVLGTNLKDLSRLANNFYAQKYNTDNLKQSKLPESNVLHKNKRKAVYAQVKLSPNGKYIAYTTNQLGQYKVWIYNTTSGKCKRIAKGDYKLDRITDHSYPVLNWHPKLNALTYFTERRGELLLNTYNLEDKKTDKITMRSLDKVLDFDYSDDGMSIALSAVANGKTDIYIYKLVGRFQKKITDDIFDDLNPEFIENSTEIIFSSNRVSDTLARKFTKESIVPIHSAFDIFVIDPFYKQPNQVLKRITNTPDHNEINPSLYAHKTYSFLSDENGIINKYVAVYDSAIAYVDTSIHYRYFSNITPISNYNRNLLSYDVNPSAESYVELVYNNGKYQIYKGSTTDDKQYLISDLNITEYKRSLLNLLTPEVESEVKLEQEDFGEDAGGIDINNYKFEDEEPDFEKDIRILDEITNAVPEEEMVVDEKKKEEKPFKLPTQTLYKVNFSLDYVVTQADNNFLNPSYQRYQGPGSVYFNSGLNGLMKFGVSDLFEDYRVVGGFKLAGNLVSNEYLLMFDNLIDRVDHRIIVYRTGNLNQIGNYTGKTITYEGKYRASYAIDEVQSLKGTIGYRNDQTVIQSTDDISLNTEDEFGHYATSKVEYVFDNTRNKGLNLYNGTRLKFFGEYIKEFTDVKANMFVIGADIRHYQKIHKDLIWANRLAYSTSFGEKKLLYYMGGVDNWVLRPNPNFDNSVQVSPTENYAFQTIATPMRGFIQNVRNGNSFAMVNSELRFPIVKYFSKSPVKNEFLENFQILGFSDVGTAWTGAHPYSPENSFNTTIISEPKPFYIEIETQKEPIIYSYGFGLRSKLFGYFVRFDWAWGVDDGNTLKSVRYLSLTLDF